jgi:hypothetical protein
MIWICASCGRQAKTNRQKCLNCGGSSWRPAAKKDTIELAGPIKRMAPRGLLLASPNQQAPVQDPKTVECGKCHKVIYTAKNGFDSAAFQAAKADHYSASPSCKN